MVDQNSLVVRVKKLHTDAHVPKYAHLGSMGDLGADLYAVETIHLPSGTTLPISTGVAIELPQGLGALIEDRSGLALKGLTTLAGVIDPGFRGEIKVIMANLSKKQITLKKGERIAQLRLVRLLQARFEEVDRLSPTERSYRGFGSTGE
jgi:dUTP pyrophosphatase